MLILTAVNVGRGWKKSEIKNRCSTFDIQKWLFNEYPTSINEM